MDSTAPATEEGSKDGAGWIPQFYDGPSELEGLSEEELDRRMESYLQEHGHNRFLCDVCKSIFENFNLEEQSQSEEAPMIELNQNLVDLKVSADKGCQFCFFRQEQIECSYEGWNNLSMSQNPWYTQRWGYRSLDPQYSRSTGYRSLEFEYPHSTGRRDASVTVYLQPVDKNKRSRHFSLLRQMERGLKGLGSSNLSSALTSNNSYASLCTVQMWIKDCLKNHPRCHDSVPQDRALPTRLVDLGSAHRILPKLCLGTSLATETPYVSLSHCWGGRTFVRLLQSNLSRFQEEILSDTLPKTFKDAMELTKRLGIRYLWIDSLCIVQDSSEDWLRESGRMANVYRFAIVNIAATRARDGEVGCFTERSLIEVEPCQVDYPTASYFCQDESMTDSNVLNAPLMKRAWAVQEMALAPRVVHFAKTQMYWDCLELRASETFLDSILFDSGLGLNNAMEALRKEQDWNHPSLDRFDRWELLVRRYSGGDLTFPTKDKLVAISGLARDIGPSSEYVAGLWKPELAYSLAWWAYNTEEPKKLRPPEYRAPTWSWASVDGTVVSAMFGREMFLNPTISLTIVVTFLEIYIKPLGNDPYGQIEHAFLRVKGSLVVCRLVWIEKNDWRTSYLDGAIECRTYMDDRKFNDEGTKYCCPLVLKKEKEGDKEANTADGLFLQPTGVKGQYTRCGTFQIPDQDDGFRRFEQLRCISPADTPPELYEQIAEPTAEGHTQYIFTIV